MPCYRPLKAYRSLSQGGKVVLSKPYPFAPSFDLPCGKCVGCQLERSRAWALRCVHEAQLHDENCVVTLTYDDEHLPPFGVLQKDALQKFWKRLRKRFPERRFKYFACGEYGTELGRPHFHACIFGLDFADKRLFSVRNDIRLFVSDTLARAWPYGFSSVGEISFASAAYVARYTMKKVYGPESEAHYTRLVPETGELVSVPSEFVVMSRGGRVGKGISHEWFEKFSDDLYPDDFVVHQGQKYKVPRYYDNKLEVVNPVLRESVRTKRVDQALERAANNTPERLKVREKVARAKLSLKSRRLK
nr:MAG: replication initiator protein [Microvirus sp.]